jgi:ABC-2 type transport system ATP-binding protein
MITTRQLTRTFGEVVAVDGLSFEVNEGELFGIVGPDGAGKTTTLRMLAGVLRPTSGEATLDGISVVDRPEDVKHHLAYMSQRFGLYTDLTVLENLHFYADLYRVSKADRKARLERLFEFSGLEPFSDRLAGKLSGGMKQKLGLSCALIHEPRILLLDEPTFGVDPISRRDLWIIVHEMVSRGVTVVVSTSYMDEAERFDRVALLNRGRLLALDTPETLRATLGGELIAVRVEDVRGARVLVRTMSWVNSAVIFGERLHVTVDSVAERTAELRRALDDAGLPASSIERIEPSMEDVFVERIRREETP